MRNSRIKIILAIALVILVGAMIWWTTKPRNDHTNNKHQIPAVEATEVIIKPMPLALQTIGTVEATKSVAILPQVTGIIKKIHFQEGQMVKQGQPLVDIDPTPFLIALHQANEAFDRDNAQLTVMSANAKRYAALVKPGYVAKQDYEQAQATAKAQQAIVANDLFQVQQAKTQLGYTEINAPISGKTGLVSIKEGELVTANMSQPLFTINQLNSVLVNFSVPQNQLSMILASQNKAPLQAEISLNGIQQKLCGKLIFIDNTVNLQTGNVMMKAIFDNKNHWLWPGQSVPIRLIIAMEPKAMVIPTSALQVDQRGNFVYVVNNNIVNVKYVTVARELPRSAIIKSGLIGNETILTKIPPDLTVGDRVNIINSDREFPK